MYSLACLICHITVKLTIAIELVHDYCKKVDQEADIPSLWLLQAEQVNLHTLITELSVKFDKLLRPSR